MIILTPTARAQQAAPSKVPTETYKDWNVKCVTSTPAGTPVRQCFLSQGLYIVKTKQKIFEMIIDPPNEKNESFSGIIAPLGVLLSKGVVVSLSGIEPFALAFRS